MCFQSAPAAITAVATTPAADVAAAAADDEDAATFHSMRVIYDIT